MSTLPAGPAAPAEPGVAARDHAPQNTPILVDPPVLDPPTAGPPAPLVDLSSSATQASPGLPTIITRPAEQAAPGGAGGLVATIVLPCYNEQDHVAQELDRISTAMDASGLSYELLAIDDASSDGTLAVLRAAQERLPSLRVLAFRRNGGSGTARRIGTQRALGQVVVWTDADMTYPNERIPELIQMLLDDPSYDQVVGARTTEEGTHKWLRLPAKWLVRKLAERLTNERIPDLNSGLRAFRKSVALPYLRLLPPGFSCVTTITLAFLSNQHDIRYVPISYAKRAGNSKFHFVRDAYRYVLQVLRMVMYFDPLKVLMPPALWLLGIGLVKAVVDMVRHPFYFPASTVLLVLSSLIIASMALLADLVVRSRGDDQRGEAYLSEVPRSARAEG